MRNWLKKKDEFEVLDLIGKSMDFIPRLIERLKTMPSDSGLHLIKEFEPVPIYALAKEQGLEVHMDQTGAEEFHVYLYRPPASAKAPLMADYIEVDEERIEGIKQIVLDFFAGNDAAQLQQQCEKLAPVSAIEFTYVEQMLNQYGIDDAEFERRVEELIALFGTDLSLEGREDFPAGHPVHTYKAENTALREHIEELEGYLQVQPADIEASKLEQIRTLLHTISAVEAHYVRKENQLFPFLEQKGFDKPSTVMWTLHDNIRADLKEAIRLASASEVDVQKLISQSRAALTQIKDMIFKEDQILFPTALKMLSEAEWIAARQGENELDYCFISHPPAWPADGAPMPGQSGTVVDEGSVDLKVGKLSIEQINAIFSHLPVDISFVDADNRVRFYSQAKERIFPRSPGVIGREVKYCHPPKSVDTVIEIVEEFRAGRRDVAEFWLPLGEMFVYIRYFAVRDDAGTYMGVLEVMQNVEHIRGLDGKRTLLQWEG